MTPDGSDSPVARLLEQAGVEHTLHVHASPIRSLEDAARERGLRPEQIVRSLVFRGEGDAFILLLAPGPEKVSWPKLRRHLGVSRVTTATPDEVKRVTGYAPGTVSPIGLATELRMLADNRLSALATVSIGAGMRDAGIVLATSDLIRLTRPEFGDFLEGTRFPE